MEPFLTTSQKMVRESIRRFSENTVLPLARDIDAKELIIGNIKNSSIRDIWYNSKHLDYLNNFIKRTPEICKTCTHYDNISVYQNSDWKEEIMEHIIVNVEQLKYMKDFTIKTLL